MEELNFDLPKRDIKAANLLKVSKVKYSPFKGEFYFKNYNSPHYFKTEFEAKGRRDEMAEYKKEKLLYFPMEIQVPKFKDLMEMDLFKNHGVINIQL